MTVIKVIDHTDFLVSKGITGFVALKGKRPFAKGWQEKPTSQDDIQKHIADNENYGINFCGTDLFAIDVDIPDCPEWIEWKDKLPKTLVLLTGGGGWHYIFRMPEDFDLGNIKLLKMKVEGKARPVTAVEIKTTGGQIVAPGSIHPVTGEYYEIAEANDIATMDAVNWAKIKDIKASKSKLKKDTKPKGPNKALSLDEIDTMLDELDEDPSDYEKNYALKAMKQELDMVRSAPEGERNSQLSESAGRIFRYVAAGYLSEAEVRDAFFKASTIDDFTEKSDTLNSAMQFGRQNAKYIKAKITVESRYPDPVEKAKAGKPYGMNDMGNAERALALSGNLFVYIPEEESFFVWTNGIWERDIKDLHVQEFVKMLPDTIKQEAFSFPISDDDPVGKETRKALLKHANTSSNLPSIRRTIGTLQSDPSCKRDLGDFDADEDVLNMQNGILDLKGLDLTEHDPLMLQTKKTSISYDPSAKCPMWKSFISDTLSKEKGIYTQTMCGYLLIGANPEQKFWVIDGPGGSGKSTMFEVIAEILGDYVPTCPRGLFEKGKFQTSHNAELVPLIGARSIFKNEIEKGKTLDTTLIKEITGERYLNIRDMYKGFKPVKNTVTPLLIVNDLPFTDFDKALMRRMHRIRFDNVVAEEDKIIGYAQKMYNNEAAGIFNWLLEGLRRYWSEGLIEPQDVKDDRLEYIEDEDDFASYADTFLAFGGEFYVGTEELYKSFCSFAHQDWDNGQRKWFIRKFKNQFKSQLDQFNPKGQRQKRKIDDLENAPIIRGVGFATSPRLYR